jgi:hypothetical protein
LPTRLHPLDVGARLVLGTSLMLLALFLLAGRTVWATGAGDTPAVPGWAVPLGVVIEGSCAVAALAAGGFWLARRRRHLRA